jgi:hypothetical protein
MYNAEKYKDTEAFEEDLVRLGGLDKKRARVKQGVVDTVLEDVPDGVVAKMIGHYDTNTPGESWRKVLRGACIIAVKGRRRKAEGRR